MEAEIKLQNIRNFGDGKGGFSSPRSGIFSSSPEKEPVPIVQVAGWNSGPVWKDAFQSPNRPGLSELLCRPHIIIYNAKYM